MKKVTGYKMTKQEREIQSLLLLSRWKHFTKDEDRQEWLSTLSPIDKELLLPQINGKPKQLF